MPVSVMVLRLFLSHSLGHSKVKQVNFLSVNSASFRPQKGEGGERKKDRKSPHVPPSDRGVSVTGKVDIGRRSDESATRFYFLSLPPSAAVMLSFLESPQREREEEGPGGQGPLLPTTNIRQRLKITPCIGPFRAS